MSGCRPLFLALLTTTPRSSDHSATTGDERRQKCWIGHGTHRISIRLRCHSIYCAERRQSPTCVQSFLQSRRHRALSWCCCCSSGCGLHQVDVPQRESPAIHLRYLCSDQIFREALLIVCISRPAPNWKCSFCVLRRKFDWNGQYIQSGSYLRFLVSSQKFRVAADDWTLL